MAINHLVKLISLQDNPILYPDRIGTASLFPTDNIIEETRKVNKRKVKVKTLDRYDKSFRFEGSAEGYLASSKELEGYDADWLLDEETSIWTLTLFGGKMYQLESVAAYFGMTFEIAQQIFTRQVCPKVEIRLSDVVGRMVCLLYQDKIEKAKRK